MTELPAHLPQHLLRLAADGGAEPVWRNELGGTTFRLAPAGRCLYLKWQPRRPVDRQDARAVDLAAEARRLRWARMYHPVPLVLGQGATSAGSWLLTQGVAGTSAVDERWRAQPRTAVVAIARGLRRLHETLPVEDCPFTGSWAQPHAARLLAPQQLVVCHGDPCVPNTLLDSSGDFAAHVDLGLLGVADRWSDLAIASYSIGWDINFGPGYEELFFSAYGVAPDWERIAAYRALWDAPE